MTTAQQGAGAPAQRSWWSTIVQWRNWRIPAKLLAVLLVPVIASVVLGVLRISNEVSTANSYERLDALVNAQARLHQLINGVQDERTLSAEYLAGTGVNDPGIIAGQSDRVDALAVDLHGLINKNLDAGTATKYDGASLPLSTLHDLRLKVRSNTTDANTSQQAYTSAITALLGFDQVLVSQFGQPDLASTATNLFYIASAEEQLSQGRAIVDAGIGRQFFLPNEMEALRETAVRLDDKLADVRSLATPDQLKLYDRVLSTPDVVARHQLMAVVLASPQPDPKADAKPNKRKAYVPPVNVDEWNRVSNNESTQIRAGAASVLDDMRTRSAAQQDQASNQAGVESVIMLSMLLLAAALLVMVGRGLLGPLGVLRRSSLDIANRKLPEAVDAIQDGRELDTTIEPIPVHTTEEIGELARAVDAMHGQSLRLASEQASLRRNLNTTFVNVSRRSQGLVERLLRQLEVLEKNEEDPDQLSNLFKLDHLATRMRRNNENLMVLSGNDLTRRTNTPMALGDVLRGAVSEIEQYERVLVRPSPSVQVAGYVSGDLVRMLAELLDNATQYSSPDTQVTIVSRQSARSVVVEISDQGIGMTEDEIKAANERLAEAGETNLAVSRQMGLFVVSKLAARHKVQITLAGGEEGLLATVTLPEDVLVVKAGGLGPVEPATTVLNRNGAAPEHATNLFGSGAPVPPLDDAAPAETSLPGTGGDWDPAELDRWAESTSVVRPVHEPVADADDPGPLTGEHPIMVPPRPGVPRPREDGGWPGSGSSDRGSSDAGSPDDGSSSSPESAESVAESPAVSAPPAESTQKVDAAELFSPYESPFTGLSSVSSAASDLFRPNIEPESAPELDWEDDVDQSYTGRSAASEQLLATTDVSTTGWFEPIRDGDAPPTPAPASAKPQPEAVAPQPEAVAPQSVPERAPEPAAESDEWFTVDELGTGEDSARPAAEPAPGFASWETGAHHRDEQTFGSGHVHTPLPKRTAPTSAEQGANLMSAWNGGQPADDESGRNGNGHGDGNGHGEGNGWRFSGVPAEPDYLAPQAETAAPPSPAPFALPKRTPASAREPAAESAEPAVGSAGPGGRSLPKRVPSKPRFGRQEQAAEQAPLSDAAGLFEPAGGKRTAPPSPEPAERASVAPEPVGYEPAAPEPVAPERELTSGPGPATPSGGTQMVQPDPAPVPSPAAQSEVDWTSPADEGWQAARKLAEAQPSSHTAAGLPRRVPKAHLLPGSAGPAAAGPVAPPNRNAADLRGRLNSLQSGIRDGRHRRTVNPEEHSDNGQEGERP